MPDLGQRTAAQEKGEQRFEASPERKPRLLDQPRQKLAVPGARAAVGSRDGSGRLKKTLRRGTSEQHCRHGPAAGHGGLPRETGAAHTIVDSPAGFENSVPAVWATTRDDLCVVRLHGRNAAAWNRRDTTASSGRFVYEYSAGELIDISARVERIAALADDTHVLFNTNHEDQGMKNAAAFERALSDLAALTPGRHG